MATKVIILGENKPTEKKKIKFHKALYKDLIIDDTTYKPNGFNNVELISLKYAENYDLMFAYDENRTDGFLFLGMFNDGVV